MFFQPKKKLYLLNCATIAGKPEKEGPLGEYFDECFEDMKLGQESWEQAESEMIRLCFDLLGKKEPFLTEKNGVLIGGDLMNQCTASSFGLKNTNIPYLGLYGACSTFVQGALTAGLCLESGAASWAVFAASSHFSTAERQFRTPLEYGAQRSPTAQCTVTGCCTAQLSCERKGDVQLIDGLAGIIRDGGITDVSNMGAAMAPAAADTLIRYFATTKTSPSDYDLIATGDLGYEGHLLSKEILRGEGYDMGKNYTDCGLLIYDRERQDVHCGGSGCGCSALVFGAYLFGLLKEKQIRNLLLVGTGALMSPLTLMQGLSIPAIAHLVHFCTEEEE